MARDRNGGAVEQLEWLLGVARELAGSPEVTVTLARGSIAASARLVLTGIEAAGIGDDVGSALRDLCDGLEHGLLAAAQVSQTQPRAAHCGQRVAARGDAPDGTAGTWRPAPPA